MNPSKAKTEVRDALIYRGINYERLTARKVGFSDLARDSIYNVTIHGLQLPDPRLRDLTAAMPPGIILDFRGTY